MDERGQQRKIHEDLVRKELLAVMGQEGTHPSFGNELAMQGRCVERLTVGIAMPLHLAILDEPRANSGHRWVPFSTVS